MTCLCPTHKKTLTALAPSLAATAVAVVAIVVVVVVGGVGSGGGGGGSGGDSSGGGSGVVDVPSGCSVIPTQHPARSSLSLADSLTPPPLSTNPVSPHKHTLGLNSPQSLLLGLALIIQKIWNGYKIKACQNI